MPDPAQHSLEQALHAIVAGTAAETGAAFFDELVKQLARAVGTKCAWVTEWLPESRRLRALSFWVGEDWHGDYEYDIANTPCEPVIEQQCLVHFPDQLLELFPRDPDLPPLGVVSYMGAPFMDTDGRLLGHLAVMHDAPLPEDPRLRDIFEIFAGRAGAELRRLRRDRELREREQKLTRLIGSAMDAIIELDESLRITRLNRAAEKVFAIAAANAVGQSFGIFLSRAARGKLDYLRRELARQPEGQRSLWIPDGLEARRAGGEPFAAEATLSSFELDGRRYFSLILRDIDERLAAEDRIRALMQETAALRAEIEAMRGALDIVGESPALRRLLAEVEQVAGTTATVLITGETGTGKELIARAIHARSARAAGPLVKVNCAAIAATLQESEFFGHEKGAFTGATQRREGRFKQAHGGSIFLDELGELPLDLQAKLLRVLQEGEFEPVGATRTERVDVRVIAATNRDLDAMVAEGSFRRDLLYRLNVFPLHVPPLRERGDDVLLLAEVFARRFARECGRRLAPLGPDGKARLRRYDWPGNVRELQNVMERAVITARDGRLNLDRALPDAAGPSAAPVVAPPPLDEEEARILTVTELRDLERRNLERALAAAGGKIAGAGGAAERLGLNPNTLASRLKTLGIERPRS